MRNFEQASQQLCFGSFLSAAALKILSHQYHCASVYFHQWNDPRLFQPLLGVAQVAYCVVVVAVVVVMVVVVEGKLLGSEKEVYHGA